MGNKKLTDEARLAALTKLGVPPKKKRQILDGVSIDEIIKQGYAYVDWMSDGDRTTEPPFNALLPSEVERHVKLKIHELFNDLENEIINAIDFGEDDFDHALLDGHTAIKLVRAASKKIVTL